MAMNPTQLADEIRAAMGFPAPPSQQLIGWAEGVITEITTNATATERNMPSGHPISGMSDASMANFVVTFAGYPGISTELQNFCKGIITHIEGVGTVTYTLPVPAPPVINPPDAWFLDGFVVGINGPGMAAEVASCVGYPGVSAELIQFCTAVADHILNNAEVNSGMFT